MPPIGYHVHGTTAKAATHTHTHTHGNTIDVYEEKEEKERKAKSIVRSHIQCPFFSFHFMQVVWNVRSYYYKTRVFDTLCYFAVLKYDHWFHIIAPTSSSLLASSLIIRRRVVSQAAGGHITLKLIFTAWSYALFHFLVVFSPTYVNFSVACNKSFYISNPIASVALKNFQEIRLYFARII